MSDLGPLIESLEADVARLKAELARVKERETEVKRKAFEEGALYGNSWDYCPDYQIEAEANRRLAEGNL